MIDAQMDSASTGSTSLPDAAMRDRGDAARITATSQPTSPGPLLFARYAYPPNALGYCGPPNPGTLFESASNGVDLAQLSHLAPRFTGAWPYLELIAGCNEIADPLDARVVEAYWVGNSLLDHVPGSALSSLRDCLADEGNFRFGRTAAPLVPPGVCHHSYHVFAVYPWLGILRSGKEGPALAVLDRCRIRWGRVENLAGDQVTVRTRKLAFEGSRLVLGPDQLEAARRSVGGVGLTPQVAVNDVVSLHWDWVCDRLSAEGLISLKRCTAANLAAVNALPA